MVRITFVGCAHNHAGDGRKETAMPRTHEQIIAAILANLEMARGAAEARSVDWRRDMVERHGNDRACGAFQQAISLIKTEVGLP